MTAFKNKIAVFSTAIAMLIFLGTGCSRLTHTQRGAAIGAGAGGTIGAFIGKSAGNTALGAIIGGALGGTAGAFIGHTMDKQAIELKQAIPNSTITREGEGILIKFDSGILFDKGETQLNPDALTNLQNLGKSLQQNPLTNVSIFGHTDSLGTPEYNMDLSMKRAEAVKAYLVNYGVSDARLTAIGKGETDPIATNANDVGRAKNRRVEIIIVASEELKRQAKNSK